MTQRLKLLAILVIPLFFLILNIFTLGHYGINWDEPYHYRRGQAFLQYFLTGKKTYDNIAKYPPLKGDSDNPDFRNAEKNLQEIQQNPSLSDPNQRRSFYQDDSWNGEFFIDVENTYGHPALNGVLAALSNKVFYQKLNLLGDLESYRFFTVLVVGLTIVFVAFFIWQEFGLFESLFTSLILSTYPLLLAEQHFDIKDPLETSFYTLTILTGFWGIKKNKFIWLLLSIIFFSLALGTKFNIVFAVIPLALWFIYFIKHQKHKLDKKNIIIALLLAPFIIFGVLILSYPTLWKDPINGVKEIIKFYLEVGFPQTLPQGYYLFGFFNALPSIWMIITTPPIELLLFVCSVIFSKTLIRKNSFVLLLFLWLFTAIARNSFFHALNYGGVRLIMEYIPALAMLTGVAAGYLIKLKKLKKYSFIVFSLIFLGFVPTFIKLINIHPNENVYFNVLIGGLSGAKAKNIPSWGNSDGNAYYPGVEWLNKNALKNAKVSTPVGNTSNIPRFKLRNDIAVSPYYWSGLKHEGEYLVELTYDYPSMNWFALQYLNNAMIPVYENKVDGVAIAKVWKNDEDHVKTEFKNLKIQKAKITIDKNIHTLKVEIPTTQKIMEVKINEPIKNCSALKTGYVETSTDNTNWTREPEDIAVDQLNREEIKPLTPTFEFYFFAHAAKTLLFHVDSEKSCLLNAKDASVIFLNS